MTFVFLVFALWGLNVRICHYSRRHAPLLTLTHMMGCRVPAFNFPAYSHQPVVACPSPGGAVESRQKNALFYDGAFFVFATATTKNFSRDCEKAYIPSVAYCFLAVAFVWEQDWSLWFKM